MQKIWKRCRQLMFVLLVVISLLGIWAGAALLRADGFQWGSFGLLTIAGMTLLLQLLYALFGNTWHTILLVWTLLCVVAGTIYWGVTGGGFWECVLGFVSGLGWVAFVDSLEYD